MDLLGRKVLMEQGRGLTLLAGRMQATIARAQAHAPLLPAAQALGASLNDVLQATQEAWSTGHPTEALANAVPYLQAFGHLVLAWIWLDVATVTLAADASLSVASNQGRIRAQQYFYHYELPKIGAWLQVVRQRDMTCADMPEAAF